MPGADELERAVEWLDRRFGVETLWLFGSEARGTATADSDLDLAALFLHPPSPLERIEAAADLAAQLGREVDLIDLDRTSPILAMQVLRHGRLLVNRNPKRRSAFFCRTLCLYEDLKIIRRNAERSLLERVAGEHRRDRLAEEIGQARREYSEGQCESATPEQILKAFLR